MDSTWLTTGAVSDAYNNEAVKRGRLPLPARMVCLSLGDGVEGWLYKKRGLPGESSLLFLGALPCLSLYLSLEGNALIGLLEAGLSY